MKRAVIAAAVLSLVVAAAAFAADSEQAPKGQGMGFEERKADILKHLDTRMSSLQAEKACVQAAKNHWDDRMVIPLFFITGSSPSCAGCVSSWILLADQMASVLCWTHIAPTRWHAGFPGQGTLPSRLSRQPSCGRPACRSVFV
ncbi:MAG: hypothetical protein HGB21_04860 [Nitrospirae bacterium]|nr:hypothetical protein [Nitrospirota bacterium]